MAKRKRSALEVRLRAIERYVAGVHAQFTSLAEELKPISQLFETFEERLVKHEILLEKVRLTNEQAEQTLMNCMLAIRQNDALQAWYPAQRGFREMKVSGPHPIWIEEKAKEKAAREAERQSACKAVPEGENG